MSNNLPDRLSAALTERFTELGNPFAEMRQREQGPDGYPASHPVGPAHVADVLRELMDPLTELTAPALLATITELRDLRAPLVNALTIVYRSMKDCIGDEWAEEWLGEVWTQLPLNVRALAGDQDAAAELGEAERSA